MPNIEPKNGKVAEKFNGSNSAKNELKEAQIRFPGLVVIIADFE